MKFLTYWLCRLIMCIFRIPRNSEAIFEEPALTSGVELLRLLDNGYTLVLRRTGAEIYIAIATRSRIIAYPPYHYLEIRGLPLKGVSYLADMVYQSGGFERKNNE
jgi:hypothetical protein